MASTSEKGHAINVANFKTLIGYIKAFSTPYNPANPLIKVAQMDAQLAAANASITDVGNKKSAWQIVVGERMLEFSNVFSYATQIVNSFESSGCDKQIVENALSINRKIQGSRSPGSKAEAADGETEPPATEEPAGEEPTDTKGGTKNDDSPKKASKQISVSQRSYDNLVIHFQSLADLASQTTGYNPNEEELKVETLLLKKQALDTANTNVLNGEITLSNSRGSRDQIIYAAETGLVDVAATAKKYIKGAYKVKSLEYNQVKGIKFSTNPNNKND